MGILAALTEQLQIQLKCYGTYEIKSESLFPSSSGQFTCPASTLISWEGPCAVRRAKMREVDTVEMRPAVWGANHTQHNSGSLVCRTVTLVTRYLEKPKYFSTSFPFLFRFYGNMQLGRKFTLATKRCLFCYCASAVYKALARARGSTERNEKGHGLPSLAS